MAATERNNTVDTIRSLALVAICIVNVPFILLPPELALMPGLTLADQLGVFLSESLLQLKFYLLFAFIFGWGLATQATAAKESGVAFIIEQLLNYDADSITLLLQLPVQPVGVN
ncbi:hypothetical protein MN202_18395 [Rheinheimera muenzenbergensis]|uniref:Uncharacterized protein n=1 Tax=Rheinheimera muenzenbergensis TaxID=1193628 RepID=A0ABU8CBD6_9GAMM